MSDYQDGYEDGYRKALNDVVNMQDNSNKVIVDKWEYKLLMFIALAGAISFVLRVLFWMFS